MTDKILKQGQGWRLGFDPKASQCPFLLGADDWAVELTPAEFADFRRLSQELQQTVAAIAPELMAEERICCEVESELLWLEIEGYAQAYELRFILHQGRRAEGRWEASALAEFIVALGHIQVF